MGNVIERTNEEWLVQLTPDHPQHQTAIADLRQILLRGLKRGLVNRVRTSALEFDGLAEDFTQEALLKILEKKDTFAGRSKFTTWAHKVAVSIALSELRRKRWQDNSLESMTASETGDYTPGFIADPAPQPENQTERRELLQQVRELINKDLTEKQRTALMAAIVEGKSTNDIARELEMKPNAVYKLLHDARVKLKKQLLVAGLTPVEVLASFQ